MPARLSDPIGATGKFPRTARVRRRKEYARIQEGGMRVQTNAFTIIARPNDGETARLGCAVSRKVGGAVIRNRIRRLLKEVFRRRAHELPPIDFVIIAKSGAAARAREGFAAMSEELSKGLANAVDGLARREGKRRRDSGAGDKRGES